MHPRKPRLPFANAWFFPAAALYAAVLLPISVLGLLGLLPALPGLVTPAGHAREMLFGFALAVIAGYLLGPQPLRLILSLLGCWLLARVGALFWPGSWLTMGATLLFAAGLAWKVLPRFVGAAKKWRNQSVAPVVGGLALLSAVTATGLDYGVLRLLQHEALLLLAALLFFMGGRVIAPALAGHAQNEGRRLDARVQPQLEGAVLILLALALLLAPLPWLLLQRLAAAMLVAASVLSGIRLLRWQPWHCRTRADLLVLLLGYAWLVLGLLLLGLNGLIPTLPATATLHALSVGALGSLTFGVMGRTRLVQRFRDPEARRWIHPFALLLSLAALARIVPPMLGLQPMPWLLLAAGCWSLAYLALAVLLWQCRDVPVDRARATADQ
ncbi:NnrS family protein [Stutzerimonas degradans]|uniref:NnrS family protein n=1 Tax=Stutzerimonas degradans TaxID=2968968 RepID=UPI0013F4EFAA|nr:NnrS family protein [Stutzerimonas degradans]NHC10899.1 NnrS family protein [Stutzerimonas degradans]